MRLTHRDFDALQRTLLELYAYRDAAAFQQAIPNLLLKIIPADYIGVVDFEVDPVARVVRTKAGWESSPRMSRDIVERMERHGVDHPFTRYSMGSGDPSALKISDFFSLRQFRDSELYSEFYRHAEIVRLLAISAAGVSRMTTLNATRGARSKDFTERDRLIMNLLRPHFDQARRNAEIATGRLAARSVPLKEYGLTPRETEIAHWMTQGKTNGEIAVILGSRVRTVDKHVERILGKLGVENRTAAALIISHANGA